MWNYNYNYNYSNELYHHGVKGMKWGVRKYVDPDGTLTEEGKKRYKYQNGHIRNRYTYSQDINKDFRKYRNFSDKQHKQTGIVEYKYEQAKAKNNSKKVDKALLKMKSKSYTDRKKAIKSGEDYVSTLSSLALRNGIDLNIRNDYKHIKGNKYSDSKLGYSSVSYRSLLHNPNRAGTLTTTDSRRKTKLDKEIGKTKTKTIKNY